MIRQLKLEVTSGFEAEPAPREVDADGAPRWEAAEGRAMAGTRATGLLPNERSPSWTSELELLPAIATPAMPSAVAVSTAAGVSPRE